MPAWQPTPSDTDTENPPLPLLPLFYSSTTRDSLLSTHFAPCDLAHVTEVSGCKTLA